MQLKTQLLKENSKANWQLVVDYVGDNPTRFNELMNLFMGDDKKLIQRASQPVGVLGELYPQLILPYIPELISYLKTDPIDAVQRNVMRALQYVEIPEDFEGPIVDIAMNYLKSLKAAIAVKAFSMTVLRNICVKYPELAPEVILQLEILIREEVSKGVTARAKNELKTLKKLV